MGDLSKSFKKEEIFYLSSQVKKLIELLNGTIISAENEYKIKEIEKQKNKLERILVKYEPSIYDEYSRKTKEAYIQMINARKEYEKIVADKCIKETIEKYRISYENSVEEYERIKEFRNKLKNI
ncbi:hypothetical protein HF846_16435 [Clostridium cadaveris]|uniref:Uncharacterized protein n=1 Tax=Clostridium cadaveris TaxID=1529 RepID=A0A316MAM0_9CLOT|nr:hypothetical protein [Clostridium cadaveris]NME66167.1 hypothetical protein [Clostridium cadaveris]PWL55061.1 MAG: hypothetical protein DBY38_02850 [Clostridium cadaveris]UFH65824.1 hypothetical protein KQH81_04605 [Clostridium cadaveris]